MIKHRLSLVAATTLALATLTGCGETDETETEAIAEQTEPLEDLSADAVTTAASVETVNTMPTGDVLANVEDPSLTAATAPATASQTTGQTANTGSISAFGKTSAMNQPRGQGQ